MTLYAFGSNGSGQLGIGSTTDTDTPQFCPLPYPLPGKLSKIVAGGNHTLVLLDEGTVYSSGSPYDGRLEPSLPSKTFQKTPIAIRGKKVKFCTAWWEGSVFVDKANFVYTAGSGSKGEHGIGRPSEDMSLQGLHNFPPDRNQEWGQVVDLASAVDHIVMILSDGSVYGWGNGRKGQLGDTVEIEWEPRLLDYAGFSVDRVVCGRDFTFQIGKDGSHKVIGTEKWQLQHDAPGKISHWEDVGASWGSIFILTSDGKVESWGRNDHGQLAPPGLPPIAQIAVGSEHVVALTEEGKVVSWGWGEHGNCGADTDTNGDVKGKWNEIPVDPSEKVVGVGAGCATSFFWTEASDTDASETW